MTKTLNTILFYFPTHQAVAIVIAVILFSLFVVLLFARVKGSINGTWLPMMPGILLVAFLIFDLCGYVQLPRTFQPQQAKNVQVTYNNEINEFIATTPSGSKYMVKAKNISIKNSKVSSATLTRYVPKKNISQTTYKDVKKTGRVPDPKLTVRLSPRAYREYDIARGMMTDSVPKQIAVEQLAR